MKSKSKNIDNCVSCMTFFSQLFICSTALSCNKTNAVVHKKKAIRTRNLAAAGIILISIISFTLFIFLASALIPQEDIQQLENELNSAGYGWLIDYNLTYPSIEVYTENANELIATFAISGENWYKVYLTNLVGSYDAFDLKILGSAEIDYVVDPASSYNISFVPPTPDNGENIAGNSAEINISLTNAGDLRDFAWNWNGTNYTFYNDSLVLMMNFDNVSALGESSSSNFTADVSKYGNNGNCSGMGAGCNYTLGKYGKAISFDGQDDYVNCTNLSSLDFNKTSQFTISAWVKRRSTGTLDGIVSKYDNQGGGNEFGYYLSWYSDNTFMFELRSGSTLDRVQRWTNAAYTDTTSWHHVAVSYDGSGVDGGVIFYYDGLIAGSNGGGSLSGTAMTANPLQIGVRDTTEQPFDGWIDEVRIYSYNLTADEIKQHYYSNLYKYDSANWNFYSNPFNLTAGTYTYFGCAKDNLGNENCTETRSLTILEAPLTQNISNCTNLNITNMIYYLNTSVQYNYTCMNLSANNATLDCQGNSLTGNRTSGTSGIRNTGYDNITIKNCIISKFDDGILWTSSDYGNLINNTLFLNANGIETSGSTNNYFINNTAHNNTGSGFHIQSSSYNHIINNLFYNNTNYGLYLDVSARNNLSGNIAIYNTQYGIRIANAANAYNILVNNTANNNIQQGFSLESNFNQLINNTANGPNQQYGIYIGSSAASSVINNNSVSNNSQYGIYIFSSSSNLVVHNTAINNSVGIGIRWGGTLTQYNQLLNNSLIANNVGVSVYRANANNISSNDIRSNAHSGIILNFTTNNILANNIVQQNGLWDFYSLAVSTGNRVINMTSWQNIISFTSLDISLKGLQSISYADSAGQRNISRYLNITNNSASSWIFINVSYLDTDWQNAGIANESTLKIWKYNQSSSLWISTGFNSIGGVNETGNYVYANITAFSIFGVFGESPPVLIQNITNCTNLNVENGVYYLNASINNYTETCMNILANNVTLDCQGNSIDGNDTIGSEYGINNTGGFDYVTIKNCNITDFNYGIYFSNGADYGNILLNNLTSNNYGVYIKTSLNNTIKSNIADSNPNYGIALESSANNTIFNNTARSNGNGINFFTSSNNNISGNRANSNWNGISIQSGSYNDIANNNFNSNSNYGIVLQFNSDSNVILNNNASLNPNAGIRIIQSSNHNLIADNNASLNGAGISIAAACINNTVSGNTANLNSLGIAIDSSTNNTLSDNIANSNTQNGIFLFSSSDFNTLNNNTANGNTLTGIQVQSSVNTNLSDNAANLNLYYGIYIQSNSNNTIVNNNTANSNLYYGFYLYSSSHNSLVLNTVQNNSWDWYSESNSLNNTVINFTSYQNSLTFTSYDIALKIMQTGIYADPSSQKNISRYLNITNNSAGSWLNINVSYLDTDWQSAGITDENSLKIWKYNGTAWISTGFNSTGGVNATGNYVYANISNFSIFGVFGESLLSLIQNISNCSNLTIENGIYYLNQSISNYARTCMQIQANNITLDCLGNAINGNDAAGIYGINVTGHNSTMIKNCNVTDFYYGIYISSNFNNTLLNNTANNNSQSGIILASSYSNNLTDNTANFNARGIYLAVSSNNTIINNIAKNNSQYGIYLAAGSHYNFIANNSAVYNPGTGVYLSASSNNTILSNNASSNVNYGIVIDSGQNNTIKSNTASYNSPYGIYLNGASNNIIENNTIYNNSLQGIILLSSSFRNIVKANVISKSGSHGIWISTSSHYNNVTDNNVSLNRNGISVFSSSNNTIVNNIVISNTNYGMYIWSGSNYNNIVNNTINSNINWGIYIWSANHNVFVNNTANSNLVGIELISGVNNTFTNTIAQNNVQWDWHSNRTSLNNTAINLASYQNVITFTYKDIALKGMQDSEGRHEPNGYKNISRYLNITNNSADSWIFLNISYLDFDWQNANITSESSLRLWKHNESSGSWLNSGFANINGVNATGNYVYANISSFSIFGIFGEGPSLIQNISNCTNLNVENGVYYLDSSVSGNLTCMNISANNVTLDCSGYAIDGNDSIGSIGINNSAYNFTTIKNCIITDFYYGIYSGYSNFDNMLNNTISSNTYYGIFLNSANHQNLISNEIGSNYNGIGLLYGLNNTFLFNNVSNNNGNEGIFITGSYSNNLTSNTIRYNPLRIQTSSNNSIVNNTISSTTNCIWLQDGSSNNTIFSNNVSYCGASGIFISNSNNNDVRYNTAYSSGNGIALFSASSNNNIISNNASNNNQGISIFNLADYNNNAVNLNLASNNSRGFYIQNSNNSILISNIAQNNTWDFYSILDLNSRMVNFTSYPNLVSFAGKEIALKSLRAGDISYADPSSQKNISRYLNITNNSASSWIFINISYQDSDWQNANITSESSLRLWKYTGSWIDSGFANVNGVSVTGNYVYANISTFSIFGVFGEVDTNAPLISIVYPENTSYNVNISQLNYTVSDASPITCWYSLNLGITNTTITCGNNATNLASAEEGNTWTIWANDSAGNLNFSQVSFAKDTILPNITLILPLDGESSITTAYNFTFNVNDTNNITNCALILDNSIINSLISVSKTAENWMYNSSLGIAVHIWKVNCTDSFGNTASSLERTLTINSPVPPPSGGGGGCSITGWSCGAWTVCAGSSQSRNCISNCRTTRAETQACVECISNWSCSDWGECINDLQTRTCDDSNSCTIPTNIPLASRACISNCTESWECIWSNCTGGYYTPTCTDRNNCRTEYNKPRQISCEGIAYPGCTPDINCTIWSECIVDYNFQDAIYGRVIAQGKKTRICEDSHKCTPAYINVEEENCSMRIPITAKEVELCGQNYVGVYDANNKLVATVIETGEVENKKLDVYLSVADIPNLCPHCYNGIKDFVEEEVDCGGKCKTCIDFEKRKSLSQRYPWICVVSNIIATSTLIFILLYLLARYLIKMKALEGRRFLGKIKKKWHG